MAFIGIFALAMVLIIIAIILICGFVTGLVCSIIFTVRHKKTHTMLTKVFSILSYIVLGFNGSAILIIFIFAICTNLKYKSTVPEGFVECEAITMVEDGFTVESSHYVKIDYELAKKPKELEVKYAYMPEGKYMKSTWYNLYELSTESGITVVYSLDSRNNTTVYVKEEECKEFLNYYESSFTWYIYPCYMDEGFEAPEALAEYFDDVDNKVELINHPDFDSYYRFWIHKQSKSGEFDIDFISCYYVDDSLTYCIKDSDDMMSYNPKYLVCKMDEKYATMLMDWYFELENSQNTNVN